MKLFRQRKPDLGPDALSLYYASDVHGSERCWRKFLGAGPFYDANHLIMGGDLTGKAIIPIEQMDDGTLSTMFLGEARVARTEEERHDLLQAIRFNGMYPWIASSVEIEAHRGDEQAREALFDRTMLDEVGRWMALSDERIEERGFSVYVMAGNDDPWEVDDILRSAARTTFCDERVVMIGNHEMISCAFANPTPWSSPRELPEDQLYERIRALAEQVEDPSRAIFNLHVPPYDSGLDTARLLNPDLTPIFEGGQAVQGPVGSTAVRQIIEEYQPLLGLHGHIHESRGDTLIGRTLVINSGSEYNSGRIHGVVVKLADDHVQSHQYLVG